MTAQLGGVRNWILALARQNIRKESMAVVLFITFSEGLRHMQSHLRIRGGFAGRRRLGSIR